MLDEAQYASDTDESDEDYKPGGEDSDVPSEIESDGEAENNDEKDTKTKQAHRKRKATATKPVENKRNRGTEEPEKKTIEKDSLSNDEGDDEKEDALWASFLSNTGQTVTKPSSTTTVKPAKTSTSNGSTSQIDKPKESKPVQKIEAKKIVTEIFEFAGEKVEVQKELRVNDAKPVTNKPNTKPTTIPALQKSRSGSLSSVLGQIGKKNKLSVLEKSKIDWSGFKQNEGIDEEIQTHNKGRDGYLERQDFLERTDLRRFEIEKSLRQANRRK